MVLFNYSTRELTAKIVYYGPGLCGKTTNLQYIHENLPDTIRGKMLSLATKTDRTLFFDFLPVDLGEIRGMRTRVQLYTVPGQVFYNETRRLVLKGADGIVFVADSQEQMLGANVESFRNLEDNLKAHGMKLADMPHIIQFNKRDLPRLTSIEELNTALNRYNAPFYESVATSGIGVQDSLKAIFKLVLLQLTRKYDPKAPKAERPAAAPAAAAPTVSRAETEKPRPAAQRTASASGPERERERPGSIPLSPMEEPAHAKTRAVPAPPDFRQVAAAEATDAAAEEMPSFGADEIEDLVQDVEQSYPQTSPEPAWTAEPEPVAAAPAASYVEPVPVHEPARPSRKRASSPMRETHFEVDRGFDPEWQPESVSRTDDLLGEVAPPALAATPVSDAAVPENDGWSFGAGGATPIRHEPQEEPESVPVRHRGASPEPLQGVSGSAVLLTEVAEDRHLFEDPSLEVARLGVGDRKEIVVPVEFSDGQSVRRFKLSIHLRFDPLA
jgi:signal recognition particle receptor subunit beta